MPEEVGGLWQPRFAWMWDEVGQAYAAQAKPAKKAPKR